MMDIRDKIMLFMSLMDIQIFSFFGGGGFYILKQFCLHLLLSFNERYAKLNLFLRNCLDW